MKTVQEHLKECNHDELIQTYFSRYPIQYEEWSSWDLDVEGIRNAEQEALKKYIEKLCGMEPMPREEDQGIFFIRRCIENGINDEETELAFRSELLEKGVSAETYAYEFTPQAETISFLVSDAPLTQKHLLDLLADVLYEASFFGYEQEDLADEKALLDEAIAEVKAAEENRFENCIPFEEVQKDLQEKFGITFDRESEDEHELHIAAMHAIMAYGKHSKEKEMQFIINQLQAEN